MAYIRKIGARWRAEVARNGVRSSSVFATKAEATAWAAREEAGILDAKKGLYPKKSLAEAMTRYVEEISVKKKGARFEQLRLAALARDYPALAAKIISEIQPPDIGKWRDARLKLVSPGSVQRDINLLSNVFAVAKNEWKWTGDSPFVGLWRPGDNEARTRRIEPAEVKRICRWLGYVTGRVETKQQQVAFAFLVGLRTAMRAGEILALSDARVNLKTGVASVPHKMQYLTGKERTIPLTRPARRLLASVAGRGKYFDVSSASLDALFRKAHKSLLIEDMHFHDSRAEALTRLSRKVDVMTLAKISGHKDLRVLMNTYYRESSEDIAARL